MINKKTYKELVASSWENREYVSSLSLSCILIRMLILSSLIEIDARKIHLYRSLAYKHIKLLRMFPKYRSLAHL